MDLTLIGQRDDVKCSTTLVIYLLIFFGVLLVKYFFKNLYSCTMSRVHDVEIGLCGIGDFFFGEELTLVDVK